jgi:glycosyltransferase 2 family protein
VLALLVARLGAQPFLAGVRRVSPASLAAACAITAGTTILSAWRWRLIAHGLGLDIPLRAAVASYYRSQLINSTLPSGVVGDVERGVRHGRETGQVGRALRAVVLDRAAGQAVQIAVAVAVLLAWPSPVRPAMALVGGLALTAVTVGLLVARALPPDSLSWPSRIVRTARADLRAGVLNWDRGPAVLAASVAVVAGHVVVFLVAAGVDSWSSLRAVLPLALVVLLAMTVPTNLGGWGPREGVAAWAFATAGLGAANGVATATTFGILSLVATLPGVVVLLLPTPRSRDANEPDGTQPELVSTSAGPADG